MIRGYFEVWLRRSDKYLLYFAFSIILLFVPEQSYSINVIESDIVFFPLLSPVILTNVFFQLIYVITAALIVIIISILFLSKKLRIVNRELHDRNKEILEINTNLQRANEELATQKELISKEHYVSDKFYEMLVQSASDGFSFYDRDWKLIFANTAFYSMIGLDRHSYSNINPITLIHPDDNDSQSEKEQALINNGFYEGELRLRHRDGHYVTISKKSVLVKNETGEVLGSLTISRDISRLKKVHEDLIKANFDADASSRLKSSFLANISHEIRTPLNSVVGFSNLLLADDITKVVKEEYIEQINHNSEKLLQIIGDIIDLSRLESSQIEIAYEETSLNVIVNEIIEEARQVIRRNEKSIILKVKNQFEENGDLIFTDRIWLKRVLNHLMDNAVKFTLDGSVEFNYFLENEKVVFIIRDTGIGINKENLGRIFEEFSQEIGGHHRPFEGLGIGLTLAKEVVERMGGKIYVKSEKGVGSEFGFSIPYRPAGSSTAKIKSKIDDRVLKTINWSSRKCLLVDDNKDVLIYLIRILLDTGVSTITARSGIDAIEIIRNTPDIDVVLLDMQMPELNGIETAREIRKIRKNLPIIAQTAFIFENDKDIILEAGCDACLIKPIRKDHLITVMASFITTG
jgi:PAS domain S-box-containing protein